MSHGRIRLLLVARPVFSVACSSELYVDPLAGVYPLGVGTLAFDVGSSVDSGPCIAAIPRRAHSKLRNSEHPVRLACDSSRDYFTAGDAKPIKFFIPVRR